MASGRQSGWPYNDPFPNHAHNIRGTEPTTCLPRCGQERFVCLFVVSVNTSFFFFFFFCFSKEPFLFELVDHLPCHRLSRWFILAGPAYLEHFHTKQVKESKIMQRASETTNLVRDQKVTRQKRIKIVRSYCVALTFLLWIAKRPLSRIGTSWCDSAGSCAQVVKGWVQRHYY